jgi:hypothetical protein
LGRRREIAMRKFLIIYLPASMLLALLAMVLFACGGGGGDGGGGVSGTTPAPAPTPIPTKSVVITGTVPGTVAIAYDYATGMEAARDVASGTPKRFSLKLDPGAYYLMFIENEGTSNQGSYAFYNVTGGNVFTFAADTTLDLGALVFNNYPRTATPQIDPISGNENVTETSVPEAIFSPGAGEWTATRTFVNSTCSGHSPGTTVTENVTIAQGFGLVTFTPAGTTETAIGFANVNTAILTEYWQSDPYSALVTIYLTMQSDGSLAGTYSKVGYGRECSEEATITAVLRTHPPGATLTGLSINGPSLMSEGSTATYTATASWSDSSTSTVTPTWSVNSQMASISASGVLSCQTIDTDQTVMVSATYSAGGITETAAKNVTITNLTTPIPTTPIPITAHMLSTVRMFFEENIDAGGGYHSYLYIFNADSSFEQYSYENPPVSSKYVTGTWSIGASGEAILNYGGGKTFTWMLLADLFGGWKVLVDDGTGTPHTVIMEWCGPGPYPFNGSLIFGTYDNQYGDTWIFNSNGTGATTGDGGWTFTWSVDDGILKVVFPNGYVGWMYQRPSENTWTDYPVMEWAFVLKTPTGDFYFYYGGMRLTRR